MCEYNLQTYSTANVILILWLLLWIESLTFGWHELLWPSLPSSLVHVLDIEEHFHIDFPMDPITQGTLPVLGLQLGTDHVSMTGFGFRLASCDSWSFSDKFPAWWWWWWWSSAAVIVLLEDLTDEKINSDWRRHHGVWPWTTELVWLTKVVTVVIYTYMNE